MLYCKPDATDDEIHEALKKANASDIISWLEEGIDTNVGTAGG